jgi:hypothetical protein
MARICRKSAAGNGVTPRERAVSHRYGRSMGGGRQGPARDGREQWHLQQAFRQDRHRTDRGGPAHLPRPDRHHARATQSPPPPRTASISPSCGARPFIFQLPAIKGHMFSSLSFSIDKAALRRQARCARRPLWRPSQNLSGFRERGGIGNQSAVRTGRRSLAERATVRRLSADPVWCPYDCAAPLALCHLERFASISAEAGPACIVCRRTESSAMKILAPGAPAPNLNVIAVGRRESDSIVPTPARVVDHPNDCLPGSA